MNQTLTQLLIDRISLIAAIGLTLFSIVKVAIVWIKERSVGEEAVKILTAADKVLMEDIQKLKFAQDNLDGDNEEIKEKMDKLTRDYQELIVETLKYYKERRR